jgi:hypothetical protein
MEKTCRECGSPDPESGWVAKGNICKECQRAWAKQHYQDNKQTYLDKAQRNREKYFETHRPWLLNYWIENPCVDCGETDPVVLDFDHRNPDEKLFDISRAFLSQRPWKKILDEINKCDVRCANCHRRRTAKQCNWWMAA